MAPVITTKAATHEAPTYESADPPIPVPVTTKAVAAQPAAPVPPGFDKETEAAAKSTENFMRDHYAKQEKVIIKCSEDQWVQVNGYTFIIKGGERVSVPKDIAELLEASGRI